MGNTVVGRLFDIEVITMFGHIEQHLRLHTEELDLAGVVERWRKDLLQYGIEQLTEDTADQND